MAIHSLDGAEVYTGYRKYIPCCLPWPPLPLATCGLRTTIEEVLLEVMYEIPSIENVRKCVVNGDVITNRSRPLLMTVNDPVIEYAETAYAGTGMNSAIVTSAL